MFDKFSAVMGCTKSSSLTCPAEDEIEFNLETESSACVLGEKLSNIGAIDAIAFSVIGVGVDNGDNG